MKIHTVKVDFSPNSFRSVQMWNNVLWNIEVTWNRSYKNEIKAPLEETIKTFEKIEVNEIEEKELENKGSLTKA